MRLATLSLTALLLPATALAGNPFASVVKTQEFRQLGPGLVQPVSDIGFAFEVYVDGASTMTPSPTLSGPITMGEPFHNGGALGFNASEGGWGYGAPAFEGWQGPDQATLDGLFGSGTYQLSISGVPVSVPITGDVYPSSAPVLTLDGGFWAGGQYHIEADQTLTISTSSYTEYGTHVQDAVWMFLSGPGFAMDQTNFSGLGDPDALSFVVPANTLTAGTFCNLDAGFFAATFFDGAVPGLGSTIVVGGYERWTALDIVVLAPGGDQGTRYCSPAVPNSTGNPAELLTVGSDFVADNTLALVARDVPANQFGYFLISGTQAAIANPGGSQGVLCLGLPIGRYNRPGELLFSGNEGILHLPLNLFDTPQSTGPISIQPGQTWNFTCWYRDVNPTNTSNFSDAVSLTFN